MNICSQEIKDEISTQVIGQEPLKDRLLIALLCQGHLLLEGLPGIAKTLSINTLAKILGVDFKRIQFTPDLLPADLLGTRIFNIHKGEFSIEKGPLFGN